MNKPTEIIYTSTSKTCDYWPVFAKEDGQSGYNDWEIVNIVPAPKGFNEDDALDSKEDSMDTIGWRISQGIVKGGFGGYAVEHDGYDYYIVQWDSEPKKAEKTEVIVIDGEEFPVTEGSGSVMAGGLTNFQTQQNGGIKLIRDVL